MHVFSEMMDEGPMPNDVVSQIFSATWTELPSSKLANNVTPSHVPQRTPGPLHKRRSKRCELVDTYTALYVREIAYIHPFNGALGLVLCEHQAAINNHYVSEARAVTQNTAFQHPRSTELSKVRPWRSPLMGMPLSRLTKERMVRSHDRNQEGAGLVGLSVLS